MTRINVGYSAISGDRCGRGLPKMLGSLKKMDSTSQLVFFTGGTTAVMAQLTVC
jgi:hypothetical protein